MISALALYRIRGLWQNLKTLLAQKHTHPPKEASPKVELSKEWLMEVKCSSEVI